MRKYAMPPRLLILCLLLGLPTQFVWCDEFHEKVVPIFQTKCLRCHNAREQRGGFSLESAEEAFRDDFIQRGNATESHLIALIQREDDSPAMPKDSDPLSASEVAVIKKWVNNGAEWPEEFRIKPAQVQDFDWWSYKPVVRPAVPDVDSEWVRGSIDRFVLRKLSEHGLSYSQPADKRSLIRRVTYDLIGLPPTPAEVDGFVQSTDPRAYEKLVDRLLDSKHYGERWARHWLDVVKYADTCGYDKDKLRPNAWPYRDYVIRSFNEDKPYRQFIQEQVAGDVLYPNQPDGILGLGFIAAGPWDFIGHVEVPESKLDGKVARNLDRDDMVSNTINTFCSMTVQCARCHNHKFDPISQENYYGLQAIFAAVDRAERVYDLNPEVQQKRRSLENEIASWTQTLNSIEAEIRKEGGDRLSNLDKQIDILEENVKFQTVAEHGFHSSMAKKADVRKWVAIELPKKTDVRRIVLHPCLDNFNNIGAGFGFPRRFKIQVADTEDQWTTVEDRTRTDFANPGVAPVEFSVNESVTRVRVVATKLAERKNDFILALSELEVFDADNQNVATLAKVAALDSIEAPIRWRKTNLVDGKWPKVTDPEAANTLAALIQKKQNLLAKLNTSERVGKKREANDELRKARESLRGLPKGKMVYAASTDFVAQGNFKPTHGKLRSIHVLHRGNVDQPDKAATPCVLPLSSSESIAINADDESARRAKLAKWISSDDNPLVWRSIVNRVWQYHFGQGIVGTPNDFGRMGAKPTHPELLDWLAVEFRESQSFKKLHRMIVTSSVYRQSSDYQEHNASVDGGNQYLWRMKRRRLEAEEIRDSIISVSGCLDKTMGGPGYYLFALEKTTHSPHYEYHKYDPADLSTHRRSIYRFIVRSQPDPWMTTLDCADSSQSTPKRNETLTALQALSLMNNRFNLYMAEKFAERLKVESASREEQIRFAVKLVVQREPEMAELADLVEYCDKHGLANTCRLLLNLSEFVYVD